MNEACVTCPAVVQCSLWAAPLHLDIRPWVESYRSYLTHLSCATFILEYKSWKGIGVEEQPELKPPYSPSRPSHSHHLPQNIMWYILRWRRWIHSKTDKIRGGTKQVKCSRAKSALQESQKIGKLETGKIKNICRARIMGDNPAVKTQATLRGLPPRQKEGNITLYPTPASDWTICVDREGVRVCRRVFQK